jgi:hypothetical protein
MDKKTILRVLLFAPYMAQADVTIVNVATPRIHADLGASGAALQLLVGGYLIAVAMLLVTGARLGQAYGYRRAFLAGVRVFTIASLACGLASSVAMLIVARVGALEHKVPQPLLNVHLLTVPAVRWSLLTVALATSTYYVLLFTAAQYLQDGLGRSPVDSGLMLPPAMTRRLPAIGCLLLAFAYAGISAGLEAGVHSQALLVPLFGLGGLGLGLEFATVTGHLTTAVPVRYAADISGVSATLMQIGGSIAVAAIGAVYLDIPRPGPAFAATTAILAAVALLAAAALRATAPRAASQGAASQGAAGRGAAGRGAAGRGAAGRGAVA